MLFNKMWKPVVILLCLSGHCCASPFGFKPRNMPILQNEDEPMIAETAASHELEGPSAADMPVPSTLTLPSNATSIRADITDGFSCDNREYGYYADVENECQIFHVCLPVTYADGKENIFRWSFICPEETVFSQDSFTCMRREDMNIECADSEQYYELNRNFGMIDEEKNNNNNNNAAHGTGEDQNSAMSSQPTSQQIVESAASSESAPAPGPKPALASPSVPVSKPMPAQSTPPKEKPAKLPKPNRRKPSHPMVPMINPQTKPVPILPLRKMPTVAAAVPQPAVAEVVVAAPVVEHFAEVEEKPILEHKYSRRPALTLKPVKEKLPLTEVKGNQHRRRPVVTKVPLEVASNEKPQLVVEAPLSTLKIEVQPLPVKEPIDTPIVLPVVEASQSDSETQASETAEVVLKPEEILPVETDDQANDEKKVEVVAPVMSEDVPKVEEIVPAASVPIEAIEEIPAVIVESKAPAVLASEEAQPVEASPVLIEDVAAPVINTAAQEEEIKTTEEAEAFEKTGKPEDTPAIEENVEKVAAAEPTIFEENSEEAALLSQVVPELVEIVDLDSAKEPEVVKQVENVVDKEPASPDATEHVVVMEPSFEETEDLKHTVGGFKPVDPAMAAEAEALITDFLNTLMKSESAANAKPNLPGNVAVEAQSAIAEGQEVASNTQEEEVEKTEGEETKKDTENHAFDIKVSDPETSESEPVVQNVPEESHVTPESQQENIDNSETLKLNVNEVPARIPLPIQPETGPVTEAEGIQLPQVLKSDVPSLVELSTPEESQALENSDSLPNMLMTNSYPADMYHIPVKVISTPIEEVITAEESVPDKIDDKVAEPEPEISAYKPISIDDIVKLVKDRLDEMPDKKVELVMQPIEEEVLPEKNSPSVGAFEDVLPEELVEAAAEAEVTDLQPEANDIILPIYHRVTEVDADLLKSQKPEVDEPSFVQVQTPFEGDSTDDIKKTAAENTETAEEVPAKVPETFSAETVEAGAAETTAAKTNAIRRLHRSRSIKNAKMDPRKRRFLFRSDAS